MRRPATCSPACAAPSCSTGYRGGASLDVEAVVDALVALGRLAIDLEDVIQSVDINPFVALPRGGLALDALIVLQQDARHTGSRSA